MAQRLSRAQAMLRAAGARFELPEASALPDRVAAVLDVLHLVFNEGYTRSAGDSLIDTSLTREAIRLTRQLQSHLPGHDEVAGALALMLLTQAREAARTDAGGDLIPLSEQDRLRWDAALIAEGVGILERVLPRGYVGRVPAPGRDRGRPRRVRHMGGHRLARRSASSTRCSNGSPRARRSRSTGPWPSG